MPVRTINHIHLDSSDLARSTEFYSTMFGARVRGLSPDRMSMLLPSDTPGIAYYLSINLITPQSKPNGIDGSGLKPGHLSHIGLGIDIPDPEATKRLSEALNKRYTFANAQPTGPWTAKGDFPGARSIYVRDPSGTLLQPIRASDDAYSLSVDPNASAAPSTPPLVRFRNFNHVNIEVGDLDLTAAFYKDVFGGTIRKAPNGESAAILFHSDIPGHAAWLNLAKASAGAKAGEYAGVGVGIDMDRGANSAENVAAVINKRFPFAKARPDNGKGRAQSVSLQDPDGLKFKLVRTDDDGGPPK